jgi:hypothetical protein
MQKTTTKAKTNAGVLRFAQNDKVKLSVIISDGNSDEGSGEDEVEDDEDGEDGDGQGCGFLVPAQVAFDGFGS